MKCDEFELRIHELLDQRVCPSTSEQIELHAGQCSACRETLLATTALLDGLQFVDAPEISTDFTDRVMREFARPVRRRSSVATMIAALAMVAAVLLVALIPAVGVWLTPNMPVASDPNSNKDQPDKPNPVNESPRITVNESTPDNKNESTPGNNPGSNTVESIPNPQRNDSINERALLASLTFPDFQSLSDMSQQIDSDKIPGVRPIRSSFGVVLGLLRRALPGNRGDEPGKPQAGMRVVDLQNLS